MEQLGPIPSRIGALRGYPNPGLHSIGIESGIDPPSTTIAGRSLTGSKREARIASALCPKLMA